MNFQLDGAQRDLVDATRSLASREWGDEGRHAPTGGLPRAALQLLASHGLAGISIPERMGGQGRPLIDAVLVLEAVAEISVVAGDCIQALNFGAIQQIAAHGSIAIAERFLLPALQGSRLVTIAMSEPDAGSAVTDLRTTAKRRGGKIIVKGQKIFTTNADTADYFVVWLRFGSEPDQVGAVIVERDTSGFTVDSSHRFASGESYGVLYFDDSPVPAENMLLDKDGFKRMLSVFNIERLGNAARSLAVGQAALNLAVDHVRKRQQFGRRLADFQGLQWRLAEMRLKLEGARLLLYRAAANAGSDSPPATEASLAKIACNRAGFDVTNDALQMFGAYGFDADEGLTYMLMRTRGWMIAGGTIEQMLNRIAESVLGERISQRGAPARG
jgi:alkylation response protein AidB-like acyl-CoA dehydrogenase